MSIDSGLAHELDLDALVTLDDDALCEWQGAATIHGEGEVATAMSYLPCPGCGVVNRALIGDACIAMMHRVQREIPELTYECAGCGQDAPFALMHITPI